LITAVGWYAEAFGFRIRSNLPIPGLRSRADGEADSDLEIIVGELPEWYAPGRFPDGSLVYSSPDDPPQSDVTLRIWRSPESGCYRILYGDGTEFVVDLDGSAVWAVWLDPLTLEDTATYLLGPIFGFCLALRGVPALHASVVAVEGQGVAFVGDAGAGKSTTAAAFALAGYPVVTDDVAPVVQVDGRFAVLPTYPRIRLWPASSELLFGDPAALPFLTPNWDKQYLEAGGQFGSFHDRPIPLAAVYLFGDRETGPDAPRVEPVSHESAFLELTVHLYTNSALRPITLARGFDFIHALTRRVPVHRLVVRAGQDHLPDVTGTVIDHLGTLRLRDL
jgi:hypothetical protein